MANITLKDGKWWKGSITFNYDLKKIAIVLAAIAAVTIVGFGLYWLCIGISKLAVWTWHGICWTAVGVWNIKWWILGALLIALLVWALSKINWSKFQNTGKDENKDKRSWWWILLPIIAILVGLISFRSCDSTSENSKPEVEMAAKEVTKESFNEAFDWVVIARAYLDGVQPGYTKASRALVGLKFVNGEAVTGKIFEGKTYEQAMAIVAEDWRDLVVSNLNGQELSEQQLVVVTLFAMRNGKYGFLNSDFLKDVQAGNLKTAASHIALHKANGEKRTLQDEAKQYLWVLKNLWDGNISVKELIDYPSFSYKTISVDDMYDKNGRYKFSKEMKASLKKGSCETPRVALEL